MSWRRGAAGGLGADEGRGRSRGSREEEGGEAAAGGTNGRWRRGRTPPPSRQRRPGAERGSGGGRGGGEPAVGSRQPGGASTWDLKAQRRERAMWSEGVRALEALLLHPVPGQEEQAVPPGLRAEIAAVDKVLDELSTLALPVASISVEEVGTLLALLADAGRRLMDALAVTGVGGDEDEDERRLLAYSLAMQGQRACQFVSATLLKMGSDRGALPLTLRQLGALSAFLSSVLQLQVMQCGPDGQDDGMGTAMATSLQTLAQLVRNHGPRLLAEHSGTEDGGDGGSNSNNTSPPPLVLLALRLAAPPSSSTSTTGGSGRAASYEVQLAAIDALAGALAHKTPSLRPLHGRILAVLLAGLADVRVQLQSGADAGTMAAPPSLLRRLLLAALTALHALLTNTHGEMGRMVDARVAGILALEVNRLLQPRAWAPAVEGKEELRPIWVLAGEDEERDGEEDGVISRGRSVRGGGRPKPSQSRSRSRSESTARGVSASAVAAASLPLSGRVRVQCLALVACLAAHYPKALASYWALLLPDGPAPPPRPTISASASSAPGPPPLLLILEWAEEGRVRAQAAAALAAMISTAPLRQWCDALAATMSHTPAARSPFYASSGSAKPAPPARLLTDRLLGTLLALHRALPRCLLPAQGTATQQGQGEDWRRRGEGGAAADDAPSLPVRPFPPSPYLQELAKALTTLVSTIPYPALEGKKKAAPAPPRRRASALAPGAVSVWEAAKQEMGASLALALVRLRGCLLGGDAVDAGTRHDVAHALAGAMQACHARPLLAFRSLLLHCDNDDTEQGAAVAFLDQIMAVASNSMSPSTLLLLSRPDALLLLSRVARGYGNLLCAPAERMDALVGGVVAGALAAGDDQNTRLQGLKVVEELLQWRAAAVGGGQAAACLLPPSAGGVLMRLIQQGLADPYQGVRAVACACLALCTLDDWRSGLAGADARRGGLERVLGYAEGEKASGVKANACRVLGVALPWLHALLADDDRQQQEAEAALVQRVCAALIAATHDERVGIRAQAIWAIGNVAQGLICGPSTASSSTTHLPAAPQLCAAALALLQAHPQQEKTASSAIRALGFLAGALDDGDEALRSACLAALLGAIDGSDAYAEAEAEEKEEPTARIKTRWNACCALASVLARLNNGRAWAAPPHLVRTLVHTLMTDGNAKVRAHVAAALQAVGHTRGAYRSVDGDDGGDSGFVAVVEAAVEVESAHPSPSLDRLLQHLVTLTIRSEIPASGTLDGTSGLALELDLARRLLAWLRRLREKDQDWRRTQPLAEGMVLLGQQQGWSYDVVEGFRQLAKGPVVAPPSSVAVEGRQAEEEEEDDEI